MPKLSDWNVEIWVTPNEEEQIRLVNRDLRLTKMGSTLIFNFTATANSQVKYEYVCRILKFKHIQFQLNQSLRKMCRRLIIKYTFYLYLQFESHVSFQRNGNFAETLNKFMTENLVVAEHIQSQCLHGNEYSCIFTFILVRYLCFEIKMYPEQCLFINRTADQMGPLA